MPIFPLTLHKTYWEQGFFNITVEYDKYVRQEPGPIELLLNPGRAEVRLEGHVNRTAQNNGTARVSGGAALRNWFQQHYAIGDLVDVDIRSPECIRIPLPALLGDGA